MMLACKKLGLPDTPIVVLHPRRLSWYPMPNGTQDQAAAVHGLLHRAVPESVQALKRIESMWGIPQDKIVLLGFSAGAVVATQVAVLSKTNFASCVCLSGAVLEPDKIPPATNTTPFILQHNYFDTVFYWQERYLPTKNALMNQGYNVSFMERKIGRHSIYEQDLIEIGLKLLPILGYSK
jgi:predicted esterase